MNWTSKGVIAKYERGYRLAFIEKYSMVIGTNLTFICCVYIRRKLLRTIHTEERSVHTKSESCNIWHFIISFISSPIFLKTSLPTFILISQLSNHYRTRYVWSINWIQVIIMFFRSSTEWDYLPLWLTLGIRDFS